MPLNNSIVSNLVALGIRNNLNSATNKISSTLERMSSGLKIIHAKDNASDYVISRKMKSQLSGLDIASDNTMQATSMLNLADDALVNMLEKVNRIRELSLQSMDSSYTEAERIAMLHMTKLDFFNYVCKPYGITYAQLEEVIAGNDDLKAAWNLCNHVYRGNEQLNSYILTVIPVLTTEKLNEIFEEHCAKE